MNSTKEININQYLTIFFAYKRIVIVLLVCALAISFFIYSKSPKLYSSTTSINFEFFNPTNPLANAGGNFAISSNEVVYINTQIDLIQSKLVAEQVFSGLPAEHKDRLEFALYEGRPLHKQYLGSVLAWLDQLFERFAGEEEEIGEPLYDASLTENEDVLAEMDIDSTPWQAIAMLSNLEVENVFGTRIVNIGYVSVDRELAALIANRFAAAYIDTNLQLLRDPAKASKAWLGGQLGILKEELEKAQAVLTQYKTSQGIVVSAERVGLESTKLEKMSSELVAVQNDLRQAEVTSRQLDEIKQQGKSLLSLAAISDSPEIRAIRIKIRGLEGRIAENSSELGANHPKLRQLRSELDQARGKLRKELKTLANLIANRERLLKKKYQSLSASVAEQKKIVLGLQQQFDQISVFESEAERRKAAYDSALDRSNTTNLQAAVEKANVSVIDKARVSYGHFSPQLSKILLFSLMAAFALSVFIVVVSEFFGRKIRSPEDVYQEFDFKVLGVLPR